MTSRSSLIVKPSEIEHAANLERAWANVLATPDGKMVAYDIITRAGVYHSTHRGNSESTFLEGMRNIGLQVVGLIGDQGPRSYPELLISMNEYNEALEVVPQEDTDTQSEIYLKLGAAYIGNQDFSAAIPELQAAVTLRETNTDAHFLLGMSYFQTGELNSSYDALLRVRELDPTYPNLESSIRTVRASGLKDRY